MWPSWTFDRKLRTLQLRVLVAGRTSDPHSDATHSDDDSTVPPPGPGLDQDEDEGLDQDRDQAVLLVQLILDQLVLKF